MCSLAAFVGVTVTVVIAGRVLPLLIAQVTEAMLYVKQHFEWVVSKDLDKLDKGRFSAGFGPLRGHARATNRTFRHAVLS